ncbi:eIF-2-alpha kinase activator GCN1 [Trichoplax sp. H2]|nr:eIF-2-alpha kinase activator GCN1 [Trichoplax sp. H2]|eukprot:RDD44813.1 eIF-2-alpha kinase activator GCN1 [Trichoplax sp. H2]
MILFSTKLAIKCLLPLLQQEAAFTLGRLSTTSTSREVLIMLNWLCIIQRNVFNSSKTFTSPALNKLIVMQSQLLDFVLSSNNERLVNVANRYLVNNFKLFPELATVYLDVITNLDGEQYYLSMLGVILKYLISLRDNGTISKYKGQLLNLFLKTVINSKTVPPRHILIWTKYLIYNIDHAEFKEKVLPAVQKAALRNLDVAIICMPSLFDSVRIDLSQYLMDISKITASALRSSKQEICKEASLMIKNFIRQCTDSGATKSFFNYLLSILKGSEGKITVWTQRVSILEGLRCISYHSVSGSSKKEELAIFACQELVNYTKQETHEGSHIYAISVINLWAEAITSEIPKFLFEYLKNGSLDKASTPTVRVAYLKFLAKCLKGDCLKYGAPVLGSILEVFSKCTSQISQQPSRIEGLIAAIILCKLSVAGQASDCDFTGFWSAVLNANSKLFTSDKFMNNCSDEDLALVLEFVEILLKCHSSKLTAENLSPLASVIVHGLTHDSWAIRKGARDVVTILKSITLNGVHVLDCLLQCFREHYRVCLSQKTDTSKEEGSSNQEKTRKIFVFALKTIFEASATAHLSNQFNEELAVKILIDTHEPDIAIVDGRCWLKLLKSNGVIAKECVQSRLGEIIAMMEESRTSFEGVRNVIETLSKVVGSQFVDAMVNNVLQDFNQEALLNISDEDYKIFLCPEGELSNQNLIASLNADSRAKNVKRESKAYSYEDQLMDDEIRREISKRKGNKESGMAALDSKQRELMKAQLQKESEIRARLKSLDTSLTRSSQILESIINSNPGCLQRHVSSLLPVLLSLIQSPIAKSYAKTLCYKLRTCAFTNREDTLLADTVISCTIRITESDTNLDSEWRMIDIKSHIRLSMERLYQRLSTKDSGHNTVQINKKLSTYAFSYCFPLLRYIVTTIERSNELLERALAVICEHSQFRISRATTESSTVSEDDPQFLPSYDMLSLLIDFIALPVSGIQEVNLQRVACDSLERLCSTLGDENCYRNVTAEQLDVLLLGLMSPEVILRKSVLSGLLGMTRTLCCLKDLKSVNISADDARLRCTSFLKSIWVLRFDTNEDVANLSKRLWEDLDFSLEPGICATLLEFVVNDDEMLRKISSMAVTAAVNKYPDQIDVVIKQILELYDKNLILIQPTRDLMGRRNDEEPKDKWRARCGLGQTIELMAPLMSKNHVSNIFNFFVPLSLGDRDENVRKHMLDAALAIINEHGKAVVGNLLPTLQSYLDNAPNTSAEDAIRQAVVVVMGSLAKHLDKDDPKMLPIIDKLLDTLSTPSQPVQQAVANCLPPVIPAVKHKVPDLIKRMLQQLFESGQYGERRGAAYGLAGIVKGLGILSLKQLNIMSALEEAIQDKKNYKRREGSLFALEILFSLLGRIFEPYIVVILPHLLTCFGDGNQYVREATEDAAKVIMQKLSAHGVKLIFPSLLDALKEDSWRTKTGSVELLGAMAHCAPKQLSSCLPNIVPNLVDILGDSHAKVQHAGLHALKQIASVIKNPEIQSNFTNDVIISFILINILLITLMTTNVVFVDISSILIDALSEPTIHTATCLQTLLSTSFVHFIDAPSLALIMPVIHRALQQRSSETKKMASQIIGNMFTLTDMKDLAPYLPSIVPGLKQALLDPMPNVRHVSSKALGVLVKGMGEQPFQDLLPWLLDKLVTDTSTVDRSGAAQGLSEVVYGLGLERLEKLLPDIIATTQRRDVPPNVRDGYLMLFIYLPMTFKDDFSPFIGSIIPSVLQGLADETEYVRDTSLRAAQLIISLYSKTAISLFLPQLEAGLLDDNWRIRFSSVQLCGDLLFHLSGVTGKMSTEGKEEENFGTENSMQSILGALGRGRRDRVLSGLYMCRSDAAHLVRQAAMHVWKVIVINTPKALREMLPNLFVKLIGCLASSSLDMRHMATASLTDLVTKLGDRVLPEMIPILEQGIEDDDVIRRKGTCIGLGAIISCISREQVLQFIDALVAVIRKVLCDDIQDVRVAAAKSFHNLHDRTGDVAFDEILTVLLNEIDSDDKNMVENALDGLKQVVLVKSSTTLPFLVPKLAREPIQVRALAYVASVAGEELSLYANQVIPALLSVIKGYTRDNEKEKESYEACMTLVVSISDETTVRVVLEELFELAKSSDVDMRRTALGLLHPFFSESTADYVSQMDLILRTLIRMLNDSDNDVLCLAWNILNVISKRLSGVEMIQQVEHLRQAVRFVRDDVKDGELPGLCLPKKGIVPLFAFYREGILGRSSEIKEEAATGLGELIELTSVAALKPNVVNMTGPLIRILGDTFNGNVGANLKQFVPQLQTTFRKALNDANRAVRDEASKALKLAIKYHSRADLLFTELHKGIKSVEDIAIRVSMLGALSGVTDVVGGKIKEDTRKPIIATLLLLLASSEEELREEAAKCISSFCNVIPENELKDIVTEFVADGENQEWVNRHGLAMALTCSLHKAMNQLVKVDMKNEIIKTITAQACADRIPICCAGVQSIGCMLRLYTSENPPLPLISALIEALRSKSNDVKLVTTHTLHVLFSGNSDTLNVSSRAKLIPLLLNNAKEKNTPIKLASERCLAVLLDLRNGNELYQKCLATLDTATSAALTDSYKKVLQNVASQSRMDENFPDLLISG